MFAVETDSFRVFESDNEEHAWMVFLEWTKSTKNETSWAWDNTITFMYEDRVILSFDSYEHASAG